MNKTIQWCLFLCVATFLILVSILSPQFLSDTNVFLKNFINHEILNLLGVIVAITLASAGNLHLEFNRIEAKAGGKFLNKSRTSLKNSAGWLISMLVIAIVLCVIKPIFVDSEPLTAIFNSLVLLSLLFSILVMVDLTQLVFKITESAGA